MTHTHTYTTHTHTRRRTFLCRPGRPGFAVHALKLVEVGTGLDLIHDALFECSEDNATLRGDLYVLGQPRAWRGQS